MPYVNKPKFRKLLDPHIEPIVKLIKSYSTEEFQYRLLLQSILCDFSEDLLMQLGSESEGGRSNKNLRGFDKPEFISEENETILCRLIASLTDELIHCLTGCKIEENLSGLYNYCCTQIIFCSLPGKRYWTLHAARTACAIVALYLTNKFGQNNIDACSMVGVLLCDIQDESYRRLVARYEDEKIEENGDVTGYLEWL